MRLSPAAINCALGIALGALFAGCSGGAQIAPPYAAGASLHRAAASGTETVLYAFTGGSGDGVGPYGSPVSDSSGALYGTSMNTQAGVAGVVWKLTPSGKSYKESALYKFPSNESAGAYPEAGLILDASGALYGTATGGGKGKCDLAGAKGCGVIFKLTPAKGAYTETTLYDFDATGGSDGTIPSAALLLSGTELYGTTLYGGTGSCSVNGLSGCGTVFEISSKGSGYKVLYSFKDGTDGGFPQTSLIATKNGVLYGTTNSGGVTKNCPNGCGVVFKLTPKGGGYTESTIYSFAGGSEDGGIPSRGRGLYAASSGALYGTTQVGGSGGCALGFLGGCGTIFELTPKGAGFTESVIYNFQGGKDGQAANEELVADKSGALYGTTFEAGGASACLVGCGTIFKLVSSKGHYTESVVHSFQGGTDGALPYAGVTIDSSGDLYGTTDIGGASKNCSQGCGTAFEVTP
jgi:uncharacterized repeat protein (TIGR03803 family)